MDQWIGWLVTEKRLPVDKTVPGHDEGLDDEPVGGPRDSFRLLKCELSLAICHLVECRSTEGAIGFFLNIM